MMIYLPTFEEKIGWSGDWREPNQHIEERTHLFATMMALYPFTDNSELAKEFCMSATLIAVYAHLHGVYKSSAYLSKVYAENGRQAGYSEKSREGFLRKLWAKRRNLQKINNRLASARRKNEL